MSAMVESMRRANGRPTAAAAPSLQSMFAPPPGISPRTPSSAVAGAASVPSLPAFRAAHKPPVLDNDDDDDDDEDEDDDSGEDAPIQLSAAASTSLKDYSHSAMRLPPAPTSEAPSAPAPAPPISLPPPVSAAAAAAPVTPLSPKLSPRDACTSCHKEKRRTAVTSLGQQMFLCKQCTIDVVSRDDFAVVKPLVDPSAASAATLPAAPAAAPAVRKSSVPPPPVPRPTVPTTAPPAGAQSSPRNALSPPNLASSPRPGPPPAALRVSGRGQTPYGEVPRDNSPRSQASGPNSNNSSPRGANGVPPPPASAPPNPIYMQLSLLPPHAESNSSADLVPPPPAQSPSPQLSPAQQSNAAAAAASAVASRRLPSAARSRGPLPTVQRGPPPLAMRRSSATAGPSLSHSGERDAGAADAPRAIAVAPDFAATLSRGMMMNVGGVPPAERKPSGDLSVPSDVRPSNFAARLSTSQRDTASSRESSSRESSTRSTRATSPPLPEGAPPPTLPKRLCDKCGVNKAKKKVGTISGKVMQVCVDCLSEFEHSAVVPGGGESAASVPEPPPPHPLSPRPSLAEPVAAMVDPAKAAADATKRAERRVNIVLEIISSEEAYMKSLTLIEETYMARLDRLATNATRTQLMKTMFSNIKQVSLVSRTLLERMWAADAQREIATCFIETAPMFQAFIEYGNTCETANLALRELLTKDDVFRDVHDALRNECGQSLDMLLIQPVQRVPRYRMLLEDLLKNTEPTHPDYENIKTALAAIQKKAAGINHHIAATEEYMAELSDLLADVEGAETLLSASRKLLFHGQVSGDFAKREPMSRVDITHHIATLALAGETIESAGGGGGGGGGEDGAATLARGDSGFQTLARSRTKPAALRAAQQALSRNQLFGATVARKHYLYLFSDIVAFAKPKGVGKKKLVLVKAKPVPLGLVWVRDMPSGIAESKRDKAWELHAPGYKWVIYSASTEDKDHWLTAARVAIQRVLPPNSDVDGRRSAMHVLGDGSMYDGEWLMGLREGNGSLMHLGNRYEGTWHNDRRDDVDGRMSYVTGDIYDGRWRGSMPNGVGVMTWRDGAVYQGDFLNGRMHGKGTLVWSLGDTYTGEFFQGMMHGKGTFFYNPESVGGRKMGYHGDWRDGLFQGKGILSLADGRKYNGEFEGGLRSGNGRMLYDVGGEPRVNATSYEGAWRNGRRHGIGVLSEGVDGGRYYTGQWVDGQRHGKGAMQYGNGDKFDGEFRADLRHGTGTMTFALGAIASMEGDWHEGSMLRGTIRYRNGDEYQGPLKSNVPHGAGAQLVMPNGCKFKGTWSEGRISPGSKLIVHLPDELEPLMGTVSTDASLLINADTFGEWDLPCLLPAPQFMAFAEDT